MMTVNKPSMTGHALYIHIPFCLRKCRYCDFCSYDFLTDQEKNAYLRALASEISAFPKRERVDTVFFGGGTPSLLSEQAARALLGLIREKFEISENAEITMEANPASATEEKLRAFRQAGFNRLSIGVQSFSDRVLSVLGRLHTADEARAFFHAARRAGFENINLDLMYATPSESEEELQQSLAVAIQLAPEHISAYGLILEEGTDFYRQRDSLSFCSDDKEADFYEIVNKTLQDNGYCQYEISNYAKLGYECRHNLAYWESRPYLGFGVSAYSLYGGRRYGNTRDIRRYIENPCASLAEVEEMTAENTKYDYVMLGLRTVRGISLSEYRHLFCEDFYALHAEKIKKFIQLGYMAAESGRIYLTAKGLYLSDAILTELL